MKKNAVASQTNEILLFDQSANSKLAIVRIVTEIANARNRFDLLENYFQPFIKSCKFDELAQSEVLSMFINLLNISMDLIDADLSTQSFTKDSISELRNEFTTYLKEKYGL